MYVAGMACTCPGVPDFSGHALSKQLLFDLSLGLGLGSASVMEVGQPKALPVSTGQAGLGSEGAQGQGQGLVTVWVAAFPEPCSRCRLQLCHHRTHC